MLNFIHIKNIVDEVFQDYKLTSMLIAMPKCDFKCFTELNLDPKLCQNFKLTQLPNKIISIEDLFIRYTSNKITKALIFGGLEPFLSFKEMLLFITFLRNQKCLDDIVIYTGYYEKEIEKEIKILKEFKNIIVKFGRYKPGLNSIKDEILGISLASSNQFAVKIS